MIRFILLLSWIMTFLIWGLPHPALANGDPFHPQAEIPYRVGIDHPELVFVLAQTKNPNALSYFGELAQFPGFAAVHAAMKLGDVVISAEPDVGVVEWTFKEFKMKYLPNSPKTVLLLGRFLYAEDSIVAKNAFRTSKKYLGLPYNNQFNAGLKLDSMYCSQLIYQAFKDATMRDFFELKAIPGTDKILGISPISIISDRRISWIREFPTSSQ